jgi:hypothetical protein
VRSLTELPAAATLVLTGHLFQVVTTVALARGYTQFCTCPPARGVRHGVSEDTHLGLSITNDRSDEAKRNLFFLHLRTERDPASETLRLNIIRTVASVQPNVHAQAGIPSLRSGFDPRSDHVGFVVDKVAPEQVFSEYFGFPLLVLIPTTAS